MEDAVKIITRDNQRTDRIYEVMYEVSPTTQRWLPLTEPYYFVSPDGEGRYYYDTLDEAQAEHGDDLQVIPCAMEED
jgi:hypothetical protein